MSNEIIKSTVIVVNYDYKVGDQIIKSETSAFEQKGGVISENQNLEKYLMEEFAEVLKAQGKKGVSITSFVIVENATFDTNGKVIVVKSNN